MRVHKIMAAIEQSKSLSERKRLEMQLEAELAKSNWRPNSRVAQNRKRYMKGWLLMVFASSVGIGLSVGVPFLIGSNPYSTGVILALTTTICFHIGRHTA